MSEQQPRRTPASVVNGVVDDAVAGASLLQRFEGLVELQPRAPLVVYGEWRLSYRDVNAAANRLAHRLIALGVGRNVPVGLALDRGPDLLVAMLAVLKSGGAWVPLDPHWPVERLGHMRAAACPAVLVTRTAFLGQLPAGTAALIDLDRDQASISAGSSANPDVTLDADQWCYVLFTSGSTGLPKGVPVTQGNLAGLFPPLTAALGFGPDDVWTWFHSASFGFSFWEIFGALLHGASLVIVPEHIRQDPVALGELIVDEGVTVFSQTPSAFRRLLGNERFHASLAASRLRYLALSGEAIRRDDLAAWMARGHRARLINTYAITETAGQLTLRIYAGGDATEEGARNIGQPLPGRTVVVLDEACRPVPPGTAGELWVGGACVTPGYLAAPELAGRFTELAVPGAGVMRGYRTGDRMRQLPDGALEYLGRVDAQLKFRGYRIEPGDIEAALREHPAVQDAAVALRTDPAGNQRLTAYVVAGSGGIRAAAGTAEFWPSLGAYGIYDPWLYGLMNAEPVRLAAYRAAFAAAVPGKVVLDIGTGADAVLARLCVEAGAAHVYAVEVLPDAAARAAALVADLGLGDRITVLQGDIATLALPRPVEVCTQGIVGNIGSADGIAGIWNAARRHFAPGCVPVPERCVTRLAALELPAAARAAPRFGPLAADYTRRLFGTVGQPFDLRLCLRNTDPGQLLTNPADFEVLDFHGALATTHAGSAELEVTRDGLFDGFLLWTVVTAGAGESVDYLREQQAWLPVFMPMADEPLPLRRGDRLRVTWQASLRSDPLYPDYRVDVTVPSPAGEISLSHVSAHRGQVSGGTRLHRQLLASLAAPDDAGDLSVTELRRWLEQRVPEHLVPQSWVFLPELPLGPGGKLDREALPAPDAGRPRLAGAAVPPRNPAEQALARLWTEVLGIESPGVEDDFFDLGGDSISAVQLTTRLQRWLDAGVPLAALFESPTIAGLAGYLQEHFAGSLDSALKRGTASPSAGEGPTAPAAQPPGTGHGRSPLTFSQQSLWFLQDLYPGDTSASEQFAIRLRGALDPGALAAAWAGVVARHPVLASRFEVGEEQVWQIDDVTGAGAVRQVDLADAVPGLARDAALTALAEAALAEPFDLARGPLLRAVLCRLADDCHVLLVTAHHIVADGLSVPVLQGDLVRLYRRHVPAPPPVSVAYGELARQAAWQQGQDAPAALDWWSRRLATLPPSPLDGLVRPVATARLARRLPLRIDADLADGLRRLGREAGATPYMAMLAVFRTLLARLTGQQDFCIGTPMTLRDTPELRETVGCLVNPVVLRVPVDLAGSFRQHLEAERAAAVEAFHYRFVPFARVVQAVAPERRLGVHPLFQILFSWEPAAPVRNTVDGIAVDLLAVPAARASYFDLECAFRDAGEGEPLSGYLAWSSTALEDAVARQLPGLLCTLLADLVARPDAALRHAALLPAAERRRLLLDLNATAAPLPAEHTLHELFLAQAARTPEAVAIRDGELVWSYGQLATASAALAGELLQRGVAGRNVGVALPRSADLVLAMVAVLRAGATVVPLDPGFPPARLGFMARDAELALVLVRGSTPVAGVPVFDLAAWQAADGGPGLALPAVAAASPAMMLYTSGSTGEPKGAGTTHECAVNRCHWMWAHFGFRSDEIFALRTSPNFIDAWWEVFGALGHGVPLQVVPDAVATDPLRLPAFLADRGVTQLVLVPALLRALLEQLDAAPVALPALRWCITSGEPLPPGLLAECGRLLPRMTVLNTYGTSEIWDATAFDTRHLPGDAVRVPIGRPVANARVYVVDPAGEPVPAGIPGELQVAGPGVGPGYWRRPALTAEKFGRLSLPEVAGERVYRTGDRARILPDGNVECLGRLDAQFKVRGQRVEPAEIEQALAAHPAVAAAVVGVAGEGSDAVLVAGIVPGAAPVPPGASLAGLLREQLRSTLPAWMVPDEWRELSGLPLTPTGKLDRRSWLSGGGSRLSLEAGVTDAAPRTATERELAGLWGALLGRPDVGIHQDFFQLGGHSLLAARLLTRIRSVFGVQLELRTLFAAPTVAGLAEAIDAKPGDTDPADRVADAAGGTPLESESVLSFGQERLWFLEQLDPNSPAYNVAWTIHCTGPLEVDALRRALDRVVARHPALRTRFPGVAGRPAVVVDPPAPLPLPLVDLTAAPDPVVALGDCLTRLAREPFSLERGPLLRVTLVRAGPTDHHLLLVAHHIVTDATSNHIIFRDLCNFLGSDGSSPGDLDAAGPEPLPDYREFARRQRAEGVRPRLAAVLAWWQQRLAGAPPALELPTDRPRPAEQRFAGAWVQRALPPATAAQLEGFARARGCTPYMVLLAAFKALLHRYTGAADVLVGSPVEGRLTAGVEQVVGLFINTLVMRTDLAGDPTFGELVTRVRTTALDAQAHQEVPFEQLVEVLAPERSLSRSPVFQVMFNLVQLPRRRHRAGDLELRVDRLVDLGASSFDLTLTAAFEAGALERDGVALTFEYATDLFDAATIDQLADAYLTLLTAALAAPGATLSRLPLLDASRRAEALAKGRGPDLDLPPVPVHVQVAAMAERNPLGVAVELGGESLSYGALDAQAVRRAWQLQALGITRGHRVGICLPRGPDYLVAVLAVLKSGAAYVPLDPDYPPERLDWMAADAGLAMLIVNRATRSTVTHDTRRLDLDADPDASATGPAGAAPAPVRGDDVAYVLYTSGSTGRPKGVAVTHGSLWALLGAWRLAYDLRPGEAHLQMASAAFDVFTGDWVRALGTGGRLVICPRDVLLDPPALLGLLRSAGIRIAEFVPAVLRLLMEHCRGAGVGLPELRLLIAGSDTWYGPELEALGGIAAPGTRLINSYGVAEATIDSTFYEATGGAPTAFSGPVPIGRPFAGVTAYVLDGHGEPVPPGVPGELCIGGAGVARGYWNDPALTADRFRCDPYSSIPGARYYRTGDRARWNRQGQLELLGRADAQFKLRGFRVEPAEIEAVLARLPGVTAAAVGLEAAADGEPRLVAWLVTQGAGLDVERVSRELRRQLPAHLVPSAFISLGALPLTPNGKVDRRALAARPVPPASAASPEAAPATALEATICRLFAAVLGAGPVGADTDFFRAGGHSLLAARLVARLRDEWQAPVPLRALFEAPTPRSLAAVLTGGTRSHLLPPLIPRVRITGESVPLSLSQQRLWFLERLQPGTDVYHLHWLLRLTGDLDHRALQAAVNAVVARHEALRTVFPERAGIPAQQVLDTLQVTVRELPGTGTNVAALVAAPFDLRTGPLLRLVLLADGPREHRLLLVIHHLIADGWSFSVLSRELAAIYNAVREGHRPALAALPLQYADYSLWQREALEQGRLEPQLKYWQRALKGAPSLLDLAPARVRPPLTSWAGAWTGQVVPAATVTALRDLAAAEGCTLFMVLLAAFKALLSRLAGTDDVVVGTPVAGRSHRELEDLVGFFVNTLALRTDLGGAPTFRQLLGRVRHTALEAFDNADVPFERLVELLNPPRVLAHSPLVQVLFALHNQPRQPLLLDGLQATVETLTSETVKFDLNLHAAEEGGELRLALAWRTGLYDAPAMHTLLERFSRLLGDVVARPDATIPQLLADLTAPPRPTAPATASTGAVSPDTTAPGADTAWTPAGTVLRDIWAGLLRCDPPGPDADFFAAGGHSLLATRLVAAVAERLGVELPLISVFETPTIRGLTRRIEERQRRAAPLPGTIPRLPRRPDRGGGR